MIIILKYICLTLICCTLLLSALTYWCINKHWGIVGLLGTFSYIIFSTYLYLMSSYLFSETFLYWLLIVLLVTFILICIIAERMLFIDKKAQNIFYAILFLLSLILIGYAKLLLSWSTIDPDYFFVACVSSGLCCGAILGLFCENNFVHFSTRCFYWFEQFIKIAIGLLVSFLLIYILCTNKNIPVVAFFTALILSLWICGLSPILIKKIQHYQYENY